MAGDPTPSQVTLYRWLLNKYGVGRHGMTEGNPAAIPPVLASILIPEMLDMPRIEIINALIKLGATPDAAQFDQLGNALLTNFDDLRTRARWADWRQVHDTALTGGAPKDIVASYGRCKVLCQTACSRISRRGVVAAHSGSVTVDGKWGGFALDGYMTFKVRESGITDFQSESSDADVFTERSIGYLNANFAIDSTRTFVFTTRLDGTSSLRKYDKQLTQLATTASPPFAFQHILSVGGKLVVVGTANTAHTSEATPNTWTSTGVGIGTQAYAAAIDTSSSAGIMVAGGGTSYRMSADFGTTWTTYASPGGVAISDIKSDRVELTMAGDVAGMPVAFTSKDGISWTQRYLPEWLGSAPKIAIELLKPYATKYARIWAVGSAGLVACGRAS